MARSQRRILQGAAVAAVASGAPSSTWALARTRSPRATMREGLAATRAIATLLPGGEPGLVRGAAVHVAISLAVGEAVGLTVPDRRVAIYGAAAGLTVGLVGLRVVAPRRAPALAALPLVPQLVDNIAFGVIVAAMSVE